MLLVNPGTPLRTAVYLTFYVGVGVFALIPMVWLSCFSSRTFMAMTCWGLVCSLAAGLLFKVTVEPVVWRRMCHARNIALCVALTFSVLDVAGVVCLIAGVTWQ